jgi:hypothetical protein
VADDLSYIALADIATGGEVSHTTLGMLPTLTRLSQEQCDGFIEALVANGMLACRDGKLFVTEGSLLDGLVQTAPEDFDAAWDTMSPRPSGASAAWPSAATLDGRSC